LELPKEEHRLPANYLSEIEVELLLNQTDVKTPLGIRDRAILETLYSSAIRRNELLNLSVYDVDRNRRLLTIRQGKEKRDRVVPIGVRALEWLENLDRKIERRKIALLSRALTSDEAVVTLVSQCYDAACLRRALAVTRSRAMD
jgi:site-specific recombinase XerD